MRRNKEKSLRNTGLQKTGREHLNSAEDQRQAEILLKIIILCLIFLVMILIGLIAWSTGHFYFQENTVIADHGAPKGTIRDVSRHQESSGAGRDVSGEFLRDVFQFPADWDDSGDSAVKPAEDIRKKIKLIGIVFDPHNPQAIVEDVPLRRAVFLKEGESLYGAVLTNIQEEKVVFSYNDKTIELIP